MEIKTYIETTRRAAAFLRPKLPAAAPKVAVILGSGLARAVPDLRGSQAIPYSAIPGFPRNTVAGHEGRLVLGERRGMGVAVMQGRFHYYEGHSMESIALPVRVLEYLGFKALVVTAAVGSMRPGVKPGHFTVLKDHINLMGRNPLRAFHEEEFGTMFPDLSRTYDPGLRKLAMDCLRRRGMKASEGVYLAVGGPSYETPAEIKAFRRLGGDVVGMSVVPEVVVARQMNLQVMAITWTSNMASGMAGSLLSHPEVLALGEKVAGNLKVVLSDILDHWPGAR